MRIDTYKCDGCGTLKGELNHWFRVGAHELSLSVYTWPEGDATGRDKHYCSDACVIKAVQQWLSAQQQSSQKEAATEESNVG